MIMPVGHPGRTDRAGANSRRTLPDVSESEILVFVLTSLVVIITPGQDMILVMSRAISQGSRAGIATAAGVSTGLLGHTLLTALGLGSLLMASEHLFTVLKVVGAAYLAYLGVRLVLTRHSDLGLRETKPAPLGRLFTQGALSNLSNPRVTVFYFAFLPQFLSSDAPNPARLLLLLGAAFSGLTLLVKAPIGYLAGSLSSWLRARPLVLKWLDRASGLVLIGLAARLVLEQSG
jgi:threonine/homoserine/homoserine lactone efflux protein